MIEKIERSFDKKYLSQLKGEQRSIKNFRLLFHSLFVKPIGFFATFKIRRNILRLIKGAPRSIIGVSCGEDNTIYKIKDRYNASIGITFIF